MTARRPSTGLDFSMGCIALTEYDEDGFLQIQDDAFGEEKAGSLSYDGHHMHGFASRPMDPAFDADGQPDPSRSCILLRARDGGVLHGFPTEDPRAVPFLPLLQPGESVMYGSFWGNFGKCFNDGTITLSTTTAPASTGQGRSVYLSIGPNGLDFFSPWLRILAGKTGFHVKHSSGARLDMGTAGGLPAPLNVLKSHFTVQAGMATLDASTVVGGSSDGVQQAVALAAPVLQVLTGIQVALTSIQAALASAAPSSGITVAQIGAVQAAVTALDVLLATAAETIPSPSTAG